jgi:hypothetical protein
MASVSVLTQPLHWQTPKPLSYGTLQRSIVNALILLQPSTLLPKQPLFGTQKINTATARFRLTLSMLPLKPL